MCVCVRVRVRVCVCACVRVCMGARALPVCVCVCVFACWRAWAACCCGQGPLPGRSDALCFLPVTILHQDQLHPPHAPPQAPRGCPTTRPPRAWPRWRRQTTKATTSSPGCWQTRWRRTRRGGDGRGLSWPHIPWPPLRALCCSLASCSTCPASQATEKWPCPKHVRLQARVYLLLLIPHLRAPEPTALPHQLVAQLVQAHKAG